MEDGGAVARCWGLFWVWDGQGANGPSHPLTGDDFVVHLSTVQALPLVCQTT